MADQDKLQKTWVEMSELSESGEIVFKSAGEDIPRSRAPRRQLDLAQQGRASVMEGTPTDQLAETGRGGWSLDGKTLELHLKDWEGTYDVIELSDTTLILQRR